MIVPNGVNPKTGDTKGDNQNWNDLRPAGDERQIEADDLDFIVQLLDKTAREYDTDTARVYVTGASNGGMMAYRLLIEATERFAAAAVFIAVLPNRADMKAVEEESLPDVDVGDGCRLHSSFYPATPGGATVLFLKIDGGGHALPSRADELLDTFLVRRLIGPLCRDAEGAEIAWRFMAEFRR